MTKWISIDKLPEEFKPQRRTKKNPGRRGKRVDIWAHTFDPKTGEKIKRRFTDAYLMYYERTEPQWLSDYKNMQNWTPTHFSIPEDGP